MEKNAFKLLHDLESSWWYKGRAAVVRQALTRVSLPEHARILDFGAGYGGMYTVLSRYGTVSAFEPEEEARMATGKRGYAVTYTSAEDALAAAPELIGLFDVLEHIPDDRAFLRSAHQALPAGGSLVITVPAMPFLWSGHDVSHHHHRRYTRKTLRAALEQEGYEIAYISYWNMILFPVAALVRLLGRTGETSFSIHPFMNSILLSTVQFEAFLMRFFPLPFGISLVAIARKKG